jgi:GntR family carbon starvation induced transcriptional regulator
LKPRLTKTKIDSKLEHRTMASQLVDAIRLDIIRGIFAPDSKLRLASLTERYSAGSIPVREALSRLTASGFVRAIDQRGFSVAPLASEELVDITALRIQLEAAALCASIEKGDMAWEERVVGAHYRLSRLTVVDEAGQLNGEWESAHRQFHFELVSACNSPWLLNFVETLSDQANRYRHLSISAPPSQKRNVPHEHERMLKAAVGRDAEQACVILTEHFQKTADLALIALNARDEIQ